MSEKQVLVTGACGEIGQALVQELSKKGGYRIVTSDMMPLPDSIKNLSAEHVQGDLVYKIKTFYDYDFDIIFHLAASLSSKAEIATEEAHRINVEVVESSFVCSILVEMFWRSNVHFSSLYFLPFSYFL